MPGVDPAPGKGIKYRYRVDVEKGLDLDGTLFAEAVQKTLNDDRSWGHGGKMTFERISSGKPDFMITLASPGTTGPGVPSRVWTPPRTTSPATRPPPTA